MPPRALAGTPMGSELLWGPGTSPLGVGMRDWASDTLKLLREDERNGVPDDAKKRTAWAQISKTGKWRGHQSGPFELGRAQFESALAELARTKTPLGWDYEHASASCIPVHAPASGRSSVHEMRGDAGAEELWALTRFTKRAIAEIRDEEYQFVSPTWMFDVPDRELGAPLEKHEDDWTGEEYETGFEGGKKILACLHSVALVTNPFLDGMQPITLSRTMSRLAAIGRMANVAQLARGPRAFSAGGLAKLAEGTTTMDDAALVAELYKITGTSTPEALVAWATEKAKPADEGSAEMRLESTKKALDVALARLAETERRLAELERGEAEREVSALIRDGRATEVERKDLLELRVANPDLFKRLTANRPRVVPVDPQTKTSASPRRGPSVSAADDDAVAKMARGLGISVEAMEKRLR